jgi:hypothetical protein
MLATGFLVETAKANDGSAFTETFFPVEGLHIVKCPCQECLAAFAYFMDHSEQISLQGPTNKKHPCLFIPVEEKLNLLGALSTLRVSWWDFVDKDTS